MHRRDFLKLASMAGLGVAAGGLPFLQTARADAPYAGPLWLAIHASGGWDPTALCDPKGTDDPDDPKRINNYLKSDIGQAGNLRYAPVGPTATFFQKHHGKLLVLNGVDCATNSHDAGTRVTWSGSLVENRPAFGALVAGAYGPTAPMSFVTYGGYEASAGVVAVTRVGDTGILENLAYPERIYPSNTDDASTFHSAATTARIREARHARHEAMLATQHLPRVRQSMSMLHLARSGQNELKKLAELLPETLEDAELKRQAQVVFAAYRAGLCVAANLSMGGFDTHGDHDGQHYPRLATLLDGIDFILDQADAFPETKGNVVLVVGSDFGRTPYYNEGNGKDHWSISSMMLAGKGIPGDRVIGATDATQSPLGLDPDTLEPRESGGVRLVPGHVHAALRRLAGIDASPVAEKFPLGVTEELPLFG